MKRDSDETVREIRLSYKGCITVRDRMLCWTDPGSEPHLEVSVEVTSHPVRWFNIPPQVLSLTFSDLKLPSGPIKVSVI